MDQLFLRYGFWRRGIFSFKTISFHILPLIYIHIIFFLNCKNNLNGYTVLPWVLSHFVNKIKFQDNNWN